MARRPNRRILDLFGIGTPVNQARTARLDRRRNRSFGTMLKMAVQDEFVMFLRFLFTRAFNESLGLTALADQQ